ncbi:MAG: polysaccharide pyruvyl transferase family protein [Kiritimatiellia bacterium]
MKIGIITFQRCNNYGAELQAYALQKQLQLIGYDAENIDYLFYKHPKHKATPLSRPLLKISLRYRFYEWLYPLIKTLVCFLHRHQQYERLKRFDAFDNQMIRQSHCYQTMDDLFSNPPNYDVYIVGSDQVWNPRMYASLRPYFLDFAPPSKRRISYASSFGVSLLPKAFEEIYKTYLSKFDFLSVRESSGVEIIQSLIEKPVVHVLDPTLLLEKKYWEKLAPENSRRPYLVIYDLSPSKELLDFARKWAQIKKWDLVRLCGELGEEKHQDIESAFTAGPIEFLGLIRNAQAVVTNSFHGTVFSIIFEHPFYSVIPLKTKNEGRIESLLRSLGLLSRMVKIGHLNQINIVDSINFSDVRSQLQALRESSLQFLVTAIKGK